MGLEGQDIIDVAESGAVAVSDAINAVYGVTPTKLTNPGKARHLVLIAEKGGFRVRLGDKTGGGMPVAYAVAASISDGSAGLPVPEGASLVIPAPNECTVKGYAADSTLTYYFI